VGILGFITNEVCMLTDWRLWKRYPILILVRFLQNTIRTTALLFFVMVLALMTTTKKVDDLPVGFIAVSLGLNWMLMFYFGAKLRRFKICLYPLMFVLNPFFNWYYMVYGIFTAGQRTWGGPRADAATASTNTTARQAVEQAEQQGDELNIVPETFIPALEARKSVDSRRGDLGRKRSVVRPPKDVEGRFSARRKTSAGVYAHPDELDGLEAGLSLSEDSSYGKSWPDDSIQPEPLTLQSLMGEEDRRKYFIAQRAQQAKQHHGHAQHERPSKTRHSHRDSGTGVDSSFGGESEGQTVRSQRHTRGGYGSSSRGNSSS
jgi:chitin synthase